MNRSQREKLDTIIFKIEHLQHTNVTVYVRDRLGVAKDELIRLSREVERRTTAPVDTKSDH